MRNFGSTPSNLICCRKFNSKSVDGKRYIDIMDINWETIWRKPYSHGSYSKVGTQ